MTSNVAECYSSSVRRAVLAHKKKTTTNQKINSSRVREEIKDAIDCLSGSEQRF